MNTKRKVGDTSGGENSNEFWSCRDLSDAIPFYGPRGLYLKPVAKINVSINLPQLKIPGKTISTWEVMEKIRVLVRPDELSSLKVSKSSLEFIRLEADLEDRCRLQQVLARLDAQRLNLAGFPNILKVRAVESKDDFPTRHSWDSYFRDAKHMNELKPGERPDTVHISGLPVKWFSEDGGNAPSESLVSKIFKKWGPLRRIDVPAADPYRTRMRLGPNVKKFSHNDGIFFDAYIQYIEYLDFVSAMDALRGMKLLKKEPLKYLTANLKVTFDKTKHMNDTSVAHREFERKRLITQDDLAADKLRKKQEAITLHEEERRKADTAEQLMKHTRREKREEKRKHTALTMIRKQEEDKVSMKIAREERKLIKAQKQLESIRLLDELFDRLKVKVERKELDVKKFETEGKKNDAKLKKSDRESSSENSGGDEDKKKSKKSKKSKKKKNKKEKKKQKKSKKDKISLSDAPSDSDSDGQGKKVKSVLTSTAVVPTPSSSSHVEPTPPYPVIYPGFDPAWFYSAASPLFFSPMMRGIPRGPPRARYMRGKGRGFFQWRGSIRHPRPYNPHLYNDQYYKYFAKLTGQEYRDPDSENEWDDHSRSWSDSRRKSRSRSKTISRSRSRTRSRSRSRSQRRDRSRSRCGSRSRRRDKTRSRSSSASRRSRSKSWSKSRTSKSTRSKTPPRESSSRRKRNRRSPSRVIVTRARSRTKYPKRKSRSSSWSLPRSPSSRSCSWSKEADKSKGTNTVPNKTEDQPKTDPNQDHRPRANNESATNGADAENDKTIAPALGTVPITPDSKRDL